ncbi:MAG: hypothetical protein WAP52_01855 [Candidatus Sungiibacteriota bacterium]
MIIERLVEWRKTEDSIGVINAHPPDLIVPISYGTINPEHLARGTEQTLRGGLWLMQRFPDAKMVFSSCSYLFKDAGFHEDALRWKMVKDANLIHRVFRARHMINSIDEADAVSLAAERWEITTKHILIVTCPMHSRRDQLIYGHRFPKSKIMISCMVGGEEFQPDHPVLMQRTAWQWFFVNETLLKAMQVLGPDALKRCHHWTSTK